MSRVAVYVLAALLVLNVVTSPAQANWFGKRGDKDDLFGMLLRSGAVRRVQNVDAEAALMTIDNILQEYKRQQASKMAKATQG